MSTAKYRQFLDIDYTLLEYERAKIQHAHDYALKIHRANPLLNLQFDQIDVKVRIRERTLLENS